MILLCQIYYLEIISKLILKLICNNCSSIFIWRTSFIIYFVVFKKIIYLDIKSLNSFFHVEEHFKKWNQCSSFYYFFYSLLLLFFHFFYSLIFIFSCYFISFYFLIILFIFLCFQSLRNFFIDFWSYSLFLNFFLVLQIFRVYWVHLYSIFLF